MLFLKILLYISFYTRTKLRKKKKYHLRFFSFFFSWFKFTFSSTITDPIITHIMSVCFSSFEAKHMKLDRSYIGFICLVDGWIILILSSWSRSSLSCISRDENYKSVYLNFFVEKFSLMTIDIIKPTRSRKKKYQD